MANGVCDHVFYSFPVTSIYRQGYMVGNPITDPMFDENFRIPSAHGFGIISDQIYEVIPHSQALKIEVIFCSMCGCKKI
jgi:hypothetical protein